MPSLKFLATALLATTALAQRTIRILAVQDLSLPDTFVYKPNSLTANAGDTLEFHFAPTGFLPSNHDVALGTFDRACTPAAGGWYSGNVTAAPTMPDGVTPQAEAPFVWRVTVPDNNPMAFYCTAGQHCTRGMYGVVNPSDSQNLASYKATIPVNGPAVVPQAVGGGELVENPGVIPPDQIAVNSAGSFRVSVLGVVVAVAGIALF